MRAVLPTVQAALQVGLKYEDTAHAVLSIGVTERQPGLSTRLPARVNDAGASPTSYAHT
jgi:hypothetical protein